MKKLIYYSAAIAGISLSLTAIAPQTARAQQKTEPSARSGASGSYDEIIIRRKGNDTGKVTVQLNGSQVLINGRRPEDYKGGDVTVLHKKMHSGEGNAYAFRDFTPRGGIQFFNNRPGGSLFNSNKAQLGVYTGPSDKKGAGISDVTSGSAAEKSGLKKGDIITKIDGREISSPADLVEEIGSHQPGDSITITYERKGKTYTTQAVLDRAPGFSSNGLIAPPGEDREFNFAPVMPGHNFFFNQPDDNGEPHLGLTIQDQADGNGVKVIRVFPHSNAAQAGLKPDDIITEFAGKSVHSVKEMKERLEANKDKENAEIKVLRNGREQTLMVAMPSAENTITL